MIDASMINDFIEEAQKYLEELEPVIQALQVPDPSQEDINAACSSISSLKGSAQLVGLDRFAALTNYMENLLDLVREEKMEMDLDLLETLADGKDRLAVLIDDLRHYQEEKTGIDDILSRFQLYREESGSGDISSQDREED